MEYTCCLLDNTLPNRAPLSCLPLPPPLTTVYWAHQVHTFSGYSQVLHTTSATGCAGLAMQGE